MINTQTGKKRNRLENVRTVVADTARVVGSVKNIWEKNLANLENSLEVMRDELFNNVGGEEISITGQIIVENSTERCLKLVKETGSSHKTIHHSILRIARLLDRSSDIIPSNELNLDMFIFQEGSGMHQALAMIHDFMVTDGLTDAADVLKEECGLTFDDEINDRNTLKKIVDDLRVGEICSSLDYLEKCDPTEDNTGLSLRGDLRTQMITDCIELDNYGRAIEQLKKFKKPWSDENVSAPLLVGALLLGKSAIIDNRYKDIFDFDNRDHVTVKMTSFFVMNDSPLKSILRYGHQAMVQLAELINSGCSQSYLLENELPLEVSLVPAHSSFMCPILRETCSASNPPMRLICGHVVSRDAISRLTNSLRQMRSSGRHSRFKCPYCPREQYMDTAKRLEFANLNEVVEEYDDFDTADEYTFMNGHMSP